MQSQVQTETDTRLPLILVVLLGLQAVASFLSDSKFLPDIRNNIGFFEVTAALLALGGFILFLLRDTLRLKFHPFFGLLVIWFFLATFSQLNYLSPRTDVGFISILVLLFQIVFTLVLFNLLTQDPKLLVYVFRFFLIGTAIAAVWVIFDQITSGGDYNSAGPFKGRSHTGIYMMGGFWIVLMHSFWPGVTRLERLATYPVLALILYAIGTSLRQSVYVAMIVGFACLVLGTVALTGRNRLSILTPILFVVLIVFYLFTQSAGSTFGPLALFNREFSGLGARLDAFAGADEDLPDSENFDVLQRQGGLRAFEENPLLGIGWGAFYRSAYSPTGHEMHSSPFRFVAELGTVGILIYVALEAMLVLHALRLFWVARKTPYQLSALVMLSAIISYGVSHYYNRMFTDRPFWWMIVILLVFEYYLIKQVQAAKQAEQEQVVEGGWRLTDGGWQPAERGVETGDWRLGGERMIRQKTAYDE